MAFFDPTSANTLQHVAIPMELSGLILTVTEVFFTDKARALEQYLHGFSTASLRDIHRTYRIARGENLNYPLSEVLPTWVTWAVAATAVGLGTVLGLAVNSWPIGIGSVFILLFALYYLLVPLGLIILSRLVQPFSVLTNKHALGGFGLALGAIGLLMEIYQIITIYAADARTLV